MNVTKEQVIGLLAALNFPAPKKIAPERLYNRLMKVLDEVDEDVEVEDTEAEATLVSLLEAKEAGETITIGGDADETEAEETEKPVKKKKAVSKSKVAKKKSAPVEEEDEEAEETEKPTKKKKSKTSKSKVTKKSVVEEMTVKGATIEDMAARMVELDIDPDLEKNKTVTKLWLNKMGYDTKKGRILDRPVFKQSELKK